VITVRPSLAYVHVNHFQLSIRTFRIIHGPMHLVMLVNDILSHRRA